MKDQKLSTILSVISMICGILAPCLVCYWYVGMVFAVAAIVLGIYVQKHFGKNRMVVTAYICAGVYLAFFIFPMISCILLSTIIQKPALATAVLG